MRLIKRNICIWHDLNEKAYDDERRWREQQKIEEEYKKEKAKEQNEKYKKELIGFLKENGSYDLAKALNCKGRKVDIDIVSTDVYFVVRIYIQYPDMFDRLEFYKKVYNFYKEPLNETEEMFFTMRYTSNEILNVLKNFKGNCITE